MRCKLWYSVEREKKKEQVVEEIKDTKRNIKDIQTRDIPVS